MSKKSELFDQFDKFLKGEQLAPRSQTSLARRSSLNKSYQKPTQIINTVYQPSQSNISLTAPSPYQTSVHNQFNNQNLNYRNPFLVQNNQVFRTQPDEISSNKNSQPFDQNLPTLSSMVSAPAKKQIQPSQVAYQSPRPNIQYTPTIQTAPPVARQPVPYSYNLQAVNQPIQVTQGQYMPVMASQQTTAVLNTQVPASQNYQNVQFPPQQRTVVSNTPRPVLQNFQNGQFTPQQFQQVNQTRTMLQSRAQNQYYN